MKARRRNRKSTLKKAFSRRKVTSNRLISRISKEALKKSRKGRHTRPSKMRVKKPISNGSTIEESTVKLVKKLLGDETVDAIPGSEDAANLLQDLDLLVLGSPPEEYKRYRDLLRKEYSHLDDNSYKQMRLKVSDAQPSTSRNTVESNRNTETPSTSRLIKTSPRQKKLFIKFKDDKYRTVQIKKYKSNLKKKGLQSSLHLPTIATPTASQIVSRKILRSIRKRRNPFSRPNINKSPTEVTSNTNLRDLAITVRNPFPRQFPMKNVEKKEENEDFDDDCICIDPQPEIILIDDESTTAHGITQGGNDRTQKLKDYEPIGSMRMNQMKNDNSLQMLTSTPKLNTNSPCSFPFYGDTTPIYGTMTSNSLLSGTDECTLVEKRNMHSGVVVIDDTTTSSNNTSRGRKRKTLCTDDSVIFVSEKVINASQPTTAPAYIPLDTPVEESHFRIIPSSTPKPKAKRLRNDLFNSKEQKQLQQYNENAYNPNKDVSTLLTKKRMVIVDGSNVAYHHALNKEFSVKGLKICLDYFEKMGHEVKAVVPQFRLQKQRSTDPNELEKLHREGKIVFTPCKNLPGKSSTSYDDRFILQLASELDAAVVSNDNYRDLIHENPAFKKIIENRVVGYTWCNDLFILPKDPYGKWGPTLTTILNRS